MRGLLGRKVGMTQVYEDGGSIVPVTVIDAGPCRVLSIKSSQTAVVLAFQDTLGGRIEIASSFSKRRTTSINTRVARSLTPLFLKVARIARAFHRLEDAVFRVWAKRGVSAGLVPRAFLEWAERTADKLLLALLGWAPAALALESSGVAPCINSIDSQIQSPERLFMNASASGAQLIRRIALRRNAKAIDDQLSELKQLEESLGPSVRVLRVGRLMSQQDLADAICKQLKMTKTLRRTDTIGQGYISQVEKGAVTVSWERLGAILNACGCSLDDFLKIARIIHTVDDKELVAGIKKDAKKRLKQHASN